MDSSDNMPGPQTPHRTSLRARVTRLASGPFVQAAAKLSGGTAAAQLMTIAALPFLTRLYTPEDFELLAVYLALLGMLASIACLRFEIAIPIPESDADGADLLAASLACAGLVSALVLAAILIWPDTIAAAFGLPRFAQYLWLVPLGTLMAGLYASFQYWANRKRRFGEVARSRLTQAATGIGTQLGAGLAGWTPLGLLFGHMLYGGAGAIGLAASALRHDRAAFTGISWARVRARMAQYYRFPAWSTPEALANSAAIQLPVILIAAFTIGPEAGFVFLAARVMGAPMQLIGRAVGQVYLARAPEEMRAGRLRAFTFSILKPLALLSIPGLTLMALLAPVVFALVFGEEWRRAGILLQWMTPWFILQFLSSPVSLILHVTNRQRTAAVLHVCGLVLRTGMVLAAGLWMTDRVAEAYAISGAIFYGAYMVLVMMVAHSEAARSEG
ncbi:oligosaccharide flippase family protein [Synechococcus moorigangaii CMS01]|nr:oligosaccharide flippase family protein [Synechococcus moorigangaii CMS01]